MSYDRKCYELALLFLSDQGLTEAQMKMHADPLAQDIQNTIDDYIGFEIRPDWLQKVR